MEHITVPIYDKPYQRPQSGNPNRYKLLRASSIKSIDIEAPVFERLYKQRPQSASNIRNNFFNKTPHSKNSMPLQSLIAVLKDSDNFKSYENNGEIGSKFPRSQSHNVTIDHEAVNDIEMTCVIKTRPPKLINAYNLYKAYGKLNENTNSKTILYLKQQKILKKQTMIKKRPSTSGNSDMFIKQKPIIKPVSFQEKVRSIFNSTLPLEKYETSDSSVDDPETKNLSITAIIKKPLKSESKETNLNSPLKIQKVKPRKLIKNELKPAPFPVGFLNHSQDAESLASTVNSPKYLDKTGKIWVSLGMSPVSLVEVKAKSSSQSISLQPKLMKNHKKNCAQCFSLPKMGEVSPFGTYVKGKKMQYKRGSMFLPSKNFSMTPNHFLNF